MGRVELRSALLVAGLALLLSACKEDSAGPPAPTTPEPVWLSVSYGSSDIGVIELRPGKRGVLTLESDGGPAEKLRTAWNEIDSKGAIAVEMHLPPDDGKGRGPYGSRNYKPGEADYAMAVQLELEKAGIEAKKVPAFVWVSPSSSIRLLNIARAGEPVGTLNFSTDPPTLEIKTTKSDGLSLKGHWEHIAKQERIKVRFHQPKDGVETLVTIEAKRGDPTYPEVVRLYLILKQQYDEQRRYVLEAVP